MNAINNASARPNSPPGTVRIPGWLYIFPITLVAVVLAFNIFQPIKVLPRISLAPGFSFINQAGQRLTSEDYRGKVVLYSFTYTHCGVDCEKWVTQMQVLRERLNNEAILDDLSFALATISLDPERDTQATLREYANRFQLKSQPLRDSLTPPHSTTYRVVFKMAKVEVLGQHLYKETGPVLKTGPVSV